MPLLNSQKIHRKLNLALYFKSIVLVFFREMEYTEHALFIEIYCLELAQPISYFHNVLFFKSTQHHYSLQMPMVLVFVLKWVKCVLRCPLYIFHLSVVLLINQVSVVGKPDRTETILKLGHCPSLGIVLAFNEHNSLG